MSARLLSPRDLASALGVSESSLKRWVDAGRIRATRTEGGHRRIALTDALTFIRETGAPLLRPELLGMSGVQSEQDNRAVDDAALYHALVGGDARAVRAWVTARYQGHANLAALCDGPIRAAMHTIGELWQHDADGVFIEHRATDLCLQALASMRSVIEPPAHAPIALGGAPEDDPYLVPTAMAALVLASEGMRTINLGPDTPTSALRRAVAHHHPVIVWVSASTPLPLAQAHELAAFLTSLPPGMTGIVGGRHRQTVVDADSRVQCGATMGELVTMARTAILPRQIR